MIKEGRADVQANESRFRGKNSRDGKRKRVEKMSALSRAGLGILILLIDSGS